MNLGMKKCLEARSVHAPASPVERVKIFLAEPILAPLEHQRVRFNETLVPVVDNVEHGEVSPRLHDHVAEARRIEGDLAVVIDPQPGKQHLDILLEAFQRRVEVDEALGGANQILLPDGTERVQREIEQEPVGNGGTRLKKLSFSETYAGARRG